GVSWSVALPLPTWPNSLLPQHHNVPSVLIAQVCPPPAATELQFVADPTGVGSCLSSLSPSPSCPPSSKPQQYRTPFLEMPQVCARPALTNCHFGGPSIRAAAWEKGASPASRSAARASPPEAVNKERRMCSSFMS